METFVISYIGGPQIGGRRGAKKKPPPISTGGGLARRFWGLGAEPPICRSVAPELHPEGSTLRRIVGALRWLASEAAYIKAVGAVRPPALRAADTVHGFSARN